VRQIFSRGNDSHLRVKAERSAWLIEKRITLQVAAQGEQTDYRPYANAARIGCVPPPMPEGYANALAALQQQAEAAKRKPQLGAAHVQSGGPKGFSF